MRINIGRYYIWNTNIHFHYTLGCQKVSGKICFYFVVLVSMMSAYRNWWSGRLSGLKIRAILWKYIAAVQNQIIMYCHSTDQNNNELLEKNNFLNGPPKNLVISQRNGSICNAVSNQLIPLGKTTVLC